MVKQRYFYLEYSDYSIVIVLKERGKVTVIQYYSDFAPFLWLKTLLLDVEVN